MNAKTSRVLKKAKFEVFLKFLWTNQSIVGFFAATYK